MQPLHPPHQLQQHNQRSFHGRLPILARPLWARPAASISFSSHRLLLLQPHPPSASRPSSSPLRSSRRKRPRHERPRSVAGFWRIFNVEVPVDKDPGKDHFSISDALLEAIASLLGCPVCSLPNTAFSVARKSFDARKNTRGMAGPKFVYTVDMDMKRVQSISPELRSIVSSLRIKPGKLEFLSFQKEVADVIALVEHSKIAVTIFGSEDQSGSSSGLMKVVAAENQDTGSNRNLARKPGPSAKTAKVVVVGSGPAGLFAALVLAESGASVTLIERGQPVESRGRDIGVLMVRRMLQPDSNFSYGEGGAGTWSDGKLTTRIGRNSGSVQTVLATLVKFGAPPHILIDGKPHIGTDKLIHILRRFRLHLQSLGVDIMFGTKVVDFLSSGSRTLGVHVTSVGQDACFDSQKLMSDAVVLAVGHSARDVYEKLLDHNILMTPKDFAVGFRVEHPQELINEIQYNKWAAEVHRGRGKVPVADYKVATHVKGTWNDPTPDSEQHGCYSFCMCPGGQIVPTSTNPLELCINGMSFSRRSSKWANAAIVITVSSSEFEPFISDHGPLAGVAFQRLLEKEAAVMGGGNMVVPAQIVPDFLEDRVSGCSLPTSSYRLGVREASLHELFPQHLTVAFKQALVDFDRQIPGFIDRRALLHAVETRTSSPLRIERDRETFECLSMPGLYPIGEGAGYAGGIVSAAVDGMHAGFALAKQLGLCDDIPENLALGDGLRY